MSKTSLKIIVLVMAALMMQAMGIGAVLRAKTVTGTVVSSTDNEPLIGATIQLEGAQGTGTITDFEGNFSIEANEDGETEVIAAVTADDGFEYYVVEVPDLYESLTRYGRIVCNVTYVEADEEVEEEEDIDEDADEDEDADAEEDDEEEAPDEEEVSETTDETSDEEDGEER